MNIDILELIANNYFSSNNVKNSINLALTSKQLYSLWIDYINNKLKNNKIIIKNIDSTIKYLLNIDYKIEFYLNINDTFYKEVPPFMIWNLCRSLYHDIANNNFILNLIFTITENYNFDDFTTIKNKFKKSKYMTIMKKYINLPNCKGISINLNISNSTTSFLWFDTEEK